MTPRNLNNDPDFLDFYADRLEREAAARPHQNVAWMLAGADNARRQAAALRVPDQGELFT